MYFILIRVFELAFIEYCYSGNLQFSNLDLEDDDSLAPNSSHKNPTKRIRVKSRNLSLASVSTLRPTVPEPPNVDVRMIDFAHTSFVTNDDKAKPVAVHHGPDGGFLQGLDSLKRLLSQLLEG